MAGGEQEGQVRAGVLIISEEETRAARWGEWLEDAGFFTTTCPGPNLAWRCPRLDGERCGLREMVDVAVIDISPYGSAELYGGWVERVCTKLEDDGATVFVRGPGIELEDRIQLGRPVTKSQLIEATTRAAARSRKAKG